MKRPAAFIMGAAVSLTLAAELVSESFHSGHALVALACLLVLQSAFVPRLIFTREAAIYACFLAYMVVQLAWTDDRALATNTLLPAACFLALLVLVSTLVAAQEFGALLGGMLAGLAAGAVGYTLATGFPLRYPDDFSYNAAAGYYVFALLVAALLGTMTRWRIWLLAAAAVAWAHVVATTSIKANLGLVFGAAVATASYLGFFLRSAWRHALAIAAASVVIGFALMANPETADPLRRGLDRVTLGMRILAVRDDLPGYSAFEKRRSWLEEGVSGWKENPVFGHGVEAFRAEFGITSHSSFIDLIFNSGLIGLSLFYGMMLSAALRLRRAADTVSRGTRFVILAGIASYAFVSLAAPVHYAPTLGAFIGLSVAMLRRT